jgi:parvulin-like peptidyl-prolyl isomerase
MPKPKTLLHRARRAVVLLAACASLAACANRQPTPSNDTATSSSLPPVVANVNGRDISARFYDMYLKNGRAELGLSESNEDGRRKLELLREGIVSELIDRALIVEEAERRGLKVTPEQLDEALAREAKQLGGEEKFKTYLSEHQMSRDEYAEIVKTHLYGELLRRELSKDLQVSDAEVKAYYDEHRTEPRFKKPVEAAHILVSARPYQIRQQLEREKGLAGEALDRALADEISARRERAEELRRKATVKGADFAALAREFSEDPGTRERGGSLGSFGRDTHPRAFDEAAFSLKPGEVSKVVQTDYGFHVIKVTAREEARTYAFEEIAPDIRRLLLAQREAETLRTWLTNARRNARVRISEPYRFGKLRDEFPAA